MSAIVGNLELITTASVSSASAITVDNVFTSKYDTYVIQMNVWDTQDVVSSLLRFIDSSGNEESGSSYQWANHVLRAGGSLLEERSTSSTRVQNFSYNTTSDVGMGNTIIVYNPFSSTSFTYLTYETTHWQHSNAYGEGRKSIAVLKLQESMRGFKMFPDSGNVDTGKLVVYGVK